MQNVYNVNGRGSNRSSCGRLVLGPDAAHRFA